MQIPPENQCPWFQASNAPVPSDSEIQGKSQPTADEFGRAAADWRCAGMPFSQLTDRQAGIHTWNSMSFNRLPNLMIGGPDLRRVATGVPDPAAHKALTDGKAVVLDRRDLSADRMVEIVETTYDDPATGQSALRRRSPYPRRSVAGRRCR